ncbi:10582_t:CDS:1 [Funneliformis geosporum]|nr:10582_t:CDS:1 [Funneliformis geosporum]
MITKGSWQIAFIVYELPDSIQQFYDTTWSILLMRFSVRIEPTDINEIQTALRQQFEFKLTGLPFNTTQLDLSGFLTQIKAKSCFILRDRQYCLRPYGYINFDNIDDYDNAFNLQQKFKNRILF